MKIIRASRYVAETIGVIVIAIAAFGLYEEATHRLKRRFA